MERYNKISGIGHMILHNALIELETPSAFRLYIVNCNNHSVEYHNAASVVRWQLQLITKLKALANIFTCLRKCHSKFKMISCTYAYVLQMVTIESYTRPAS